MWAERLTNSVYVKIKQIDKRPMKSQWKINEEPTKSIKEKWKQYYPKERKWNENKVQLTKVNK